jgi:hypothetical protein
MSLRFVIFVVMRRPGVGGTFETGASKNRALEKSHPAVGIDLSPLTFAMTVLRR